MRFKNGIDNTDAVHSILKGKRLGLITNPTGVNAQLESTAAILKKHFKLQAVYGPEHGIRGDCQAGVPTEAPEIDPELGVRSYSLFGKTRHLTPEMLDGIDMLVYDIQDIGARFYTGMRRKGHSSHGSRQDESYRRQQDRGHPAETRTALLRRRISDSRKIRTDRRRIREIRQ